MFVLQRCKDLTQKLKAFIEGHILKSITKDIKLILKDWIILQGFEHTIQWKIEYFSAWNKGLQNASVTN